MSFYHEKFRFPIYQDYKLRSDYISQYTTFDLKIYKLFGRTAMIGIGTAHEQLGLQPNITSSVTFTGNNTYWNTYLFFQKNNLDLKVFPHKGSYVDFQAGLIYGQKPDYKFVTQGGSISSDTLNIVFDSYQQVKLKYGKYFPLSPKWTILAQTNHGINFNYKASYFNFYSVGGINDFIRNQIPFVGLTENQVNAHSISTLLAGIQFEPVPNLLATLKANVGIQDYLDSERSDLSYKNFLSGYALSAGYRSALGPIEISLIYSDQAKQFKGYVNIGFTF